MIVCDTHVLVYDALGIKPLGTAARRALERATRAGEVTCSDASVWELAALIGSGRIPAHGEPRVDIAKILAAREVRVLPIDADIAVTATGLLAGRTDPYDRIIAATAIVHRATLVSADERMHGIAGLKVVW